MEPSLKYEIVTTAWRKSEEKESGCGLGSNTRDMCVWAFRALYNYFHVSYSGIQFNVIIKSPSWHTPFLKTWVLKQNTRTNRKNKSWFVFEVTWLSVDIEDESGKLKNAYMNDSRIKIEGRKRLVYAEGMESLVLYVHDIFLIIKTKENTGKGI